MLRMNATWYQPRFWLASSTILTIALVVEYITVEHLFYPKNNVLGDSEYPVVRNPPGNVRSNSGLKRQANVPNPGKV